MHHKKKVFAGAIVSVWAIVRINRGPRRNPQRIDFENSLSFAWRQMRPTLAYTMPKVLLEALTSVAQDLDYLNWQIAAQP
jgi:hypothetical protein